MSKMPIVEASALDLGEAKVPLLEDNINDEQESDLLVGRIWTESKNLWHIAGPAILNRVSNYTMLVITQVFAGHLGDLELAASSIAINVILGLDFGLMVSKVPSFSLVSNCKNKQKNRSFFFNVLHD